MYANRLFRKPSSQLQPQNKQVLLDAPEVPILENFRDNRALQDKGAAYAAQANAI